MSGSPRDAIVIGAGVDGLAAAATLARGGLRVTLLEQAEAPGGRHRPIEFAPGFRAAPMAPDAGWLPAEVTRTLGITEPSRVAAGPGLAVAIAPGSFLSLPADPVRAAESIRSHSADDAAKWPEFVAALRRLAGMLEALYVRPAPDVSASSPRELLPLIELGVRFRALGRRDMIEFLRTLPLSVWELLDDTFECGPLKAAVATGGILDHPQGPRSGGTGFVLLHHLVGAPEGVVRGRAAWNGGAGAFLKTAEAAVRGLHAEIRTGARVTRILVERDAVAGVVLDGGEELRARIVLSTADPARTLLEWVDPVWLDPEFLLAVRNIRHRGRTAAVMYALEAPPEFPGLSDPQALSGVLSLSATLAELERASDAAKYGSVAETPHVELTVPSLGSGEFAARGGHVLVARVHGAPYRLREGGTWDAARRDALASRVTAMIEAVSPAFGSRVLHRTCWTPLDLEQRYGYVEGAATGGELGLDQILFMRPLAGWGQHGTPLRGLYLGGAGSHPGPGILGAAGWLAARRALNGAARS